MSTRCPGNELLVISIFSEWIEAEMSAKQDQYIFARKIRGKNSGMCNQRN